MNAQVAGYLLAIVLVVIVAELVWFATRPTRSLTVIANLIAAAALVGAALFAITEIYGGVPVALGVALLAHGYELRMRGR